jgi:hypothetical protein
MEDEFQNIVSFYDLIYYGVFVAYNNKGECVDVKIVEFYN